MTPSRIAFAEAIAEVCGADMTPEWVAACDQILIRLWLFGYCLAPIPEEREPK